jgi:hypothetical protein
MRHLCEIFEQFPDHSTLWRDSTLGTKKAHRKLKDLAKKCGNPMYGIDLVDGEIIRIDGNQRANEVSSASTGHFKKEPRGVAASRRTENA